MCGIFGVISTGVSKNPGRKVRQAFEQLARLSISRGNDSSGIVMKYNGVAHIVKGNVPVTRLLHSELYRAAVHPAFSAIENGKPALIMGHARLVTNGSQMQQLNNQPVLKDGLVAIHNGIIVNDEAIWRNHPRLKRLYEIDTESLMALVAHKHSAGSDYKTAFTHAIGQVKGTVSMALMAPDRVILFTNTGSLYVAEYNGLTFFASEKAYLKKIRSYLGLPASAISQLPLYKVIEFSLPSCDSAAGKPVSIATDIIEGSALGEVVIDPEKYSHNKSAEPLYLMLENNRERINAMQRCTMCVLPSSFPFIAFDDAGVCNYCRNYRPRLAVKGRKSLDEILSKFRSNDGQPDCMVPFSGGRDSCYTLHLLKKELGMHPIAFTYEWGMVTDVARRNAALVCGKLGIENIIVAADIRKKRANIRKNLLAWLKNPHLGLVPLLMAGDKYFFYHCNRLMALNALNVSVWGINPLENTDFKSGFTGIKPHFQKETIDQLKIFDKVKLALFFGTQFLKNPRFLNSSLVDSVGAFGARYLMRRSGHVSLFDHIGWNEKNVDAVLLNEYDWEVAIDSPSTWRIGDGTAAFYNYIYLTVAGFTEFDTFRSNQIREGQLSREAALALISKENCPRYENIRWYLEIIGVDYKTTIERINTLPKLYA